jgi:hypothetical protein
MVRMIRFFMPVFISTVFISAFLLFQVQPIIARYILPWYGGSPAVWTTCMLFFQVGLLAGYTYAHLLVSKFRQRQSWQVGIHLALLVTAFLMLPITPPEALKPTGTEASPVGGIVYLLFVTVGLPYIAISASGPLLQHWFGGVFPGRSPYRLYAVSNAGSLLGLLSYPFIFEPNLSLGQQTGLWSLGYVVYALLAGLCAWLFVKNRDAAALASGQRLPGSAATKPPLSDWLMWIALAACGSVLLLSTTNQMCQDVASVPFLWVLPLSLYLVTFIISFDHLRWYVRRVWVPLAMVSVGLVVYLLNQDLGGSDWPLPVQILVYTSAMFACCMVCHGEMVRLKPDPQYLTSFYLAVSLGGALGGVFVGLIAPRIFNGYWELHFGLLAAAILASLCFFKDYRQRVFQFPYIAGSLTWMLAIVAMAVFLGKHVVDALDATIVSKRGFYGVLRVFEGDDFDGNQYRTLRHGTISHGRQLMDDKYRRWPATYYSEESGAGVLISYLRKQSEADAPPLKLGVVGLGVGTLATWAKPGETVRFYEINAQVEQLARTFFTYLEDCPGEETVVLGDARVTLERELEAGGSQQFDALFVDAFSGDSIPMHLLTLEAFKLYFQHLKPDGVLAVHTTNNHLDLSDPVRVAAEELGKEAMMVERDPDNWSEYYSSWVLIGNDGALLESIDKDGWVTPWETDRPKAIRWTDDYSNLLQVLEWE